MIFAGTERQSGETMSIINPWTNESIAQVELASQPMLEEAGRAAKEAYTNLQQTSTQERHEQLQRTADLIGTHAGELTETIIAESGKPRRYAEGEVKRAQMTFSLAADTLRSQNGEVLPLDLRPGLEGRMGVVKRFGAGPVLGITPFNFPLNLVAHKVAPAMMAGNPLILKPAERTPLTALKLGQLLLEAGFPPEGLFILPTVPQRLEPLITGDDVNILSFTGSDAVGWELKAKAGKKKVSLELGGDAAAVVLADADLDAAIPSLVQGAFAYAGQVCISVQRLIVEEAIFDEVRSRFLDAMGQVACGDPTDRETICGPLVDRKAYDKIGHWLEEAAGKGASITGGATDEAHNLRHPALVEHLAPDTLLARNEAFGPLVVLQAATDATDAFRQVNASRFGLQAGLFTRDEALIKRAFHELHVGGVVVNQAPILRVDNMPYGGVKDSGFGREGVRYAYEEMTEPRLLIW